MQQLDNPLLISTVKKPFYISISTENRLNQDVMDSFLEKSKENQIDWKTFNVEKKLEIKNAEIENANTNEFDFIEKVEEKVTRDNLESDYALLENESIAHTFLCKANKGYSLIQIDSKNPNIIGFKCSSQDCFYSAQFTRQKDGFHLTNQTHHTCPKPIIVPYEKLAEVIFQKGKCDHLNINYMMKINSEFGLPPDSINKLGIRRIYNTVFNLSLDERILSWGKLESLIRIIISSGGNSIIHKNNFEHMVLSCFIQEDEQAMVNTLVIKIPPWPLLQFLPPGSCVEFLL